MKTKTITITLYSFKELSEEAQQKAIENLYDLNVNYETYEDAERIGLKLTSFDLDRNRHAKGKILVDHLEMAELIFKEHGKDCDTYKTATEFIKARTALVAKYSDGKQLDIVDEDKEYDFDQECDELENDFLNSIIEDYSMMLQNEYEYQTSEEAIIESIEANEYTFTKDGKLEN